MIDFEQPFIIPEVYESAILEENVDGTGGLTISWNDSRNQCIPLGTSIMYRDTKYSLLDPYYPRKSGAVTYRYEPTFRHPLARLGRIPFYIKSKDSQNNDVTLSASAYTGSAATIAAKLASFFLEYGALDSEFKDTFCKKKVAGNWDYDYAWHAEGAPSTTITVNFDGCSIRDAATRIADAIGCNVFFDWKQRKIRFVAGTSITGDTYNCLHVLGGTTNMSRITLSGNPTPVVQRLTMDDDEPQVIDAEANGRSFKFSPGSMIDWSNGGLRLTQEVVLDYIYPKLELFVSEVYERQCYLTDKDTGEKIVDHWVLNGEPVAEGTEGATAVYKLYSTWYVKVTNNSQQAEFEYSDSMLLAGKTLGILFQPSLSVDEGSCPLAGRSFDVAYFSEATPEWEKDDVRAENNKFVAPANSFRIDYKAEGDVILPSTSEQLIIPQVGNRVTLLNVALDGTYITRARQQLRDAALEIASKMVNNVGDHTFTGIRHSQLGYDIGDEYNEAPFDTNPGAIVKSISENLDTQLCDFTVGTLGTKTLTGGLRDKMASSGGGSSAAIYGESLGIGTGNGGTSATEVHAIMQATPNSYLAERMETFGTNLSAVMAQSDRQFNIWFGSGVPTASNSPASGWTTTAEKAAHVQDIYYDVQRSAGSTGGRAWRWMFHAAGTTVGEETFAADTYRWESIDDADTIAALEKLSDAANDGILSGGAEKSRIFAEWTQAYYEYIQLTGASVNYNVATELAAYTEAFVNLYKMLNGTPFISGNVTIPTNVMVEPALLSSAGDAIYTDTKLSDLNLTADQYRGRWSDYYNARETLRNALIQQGKSLTLAALGMAVADMAIFTSVEIPAPPYKVGDLWIKLPASGATEGELYKCIAARASGATPSLADWTPARSSATVTSLLADLAEKLETFFGDRYSESSDDVVNVFISSSQPSFMEGLVGDVWFDGEHIKICGLRAPSSQPYWHTWSGENASSIAIFTSIQDVLGYTKFQFHKELDSQAGIYDVCFARGTFSDELTGQNIDSGLTVWVHGKKSWEKVRDNTTGVLRNYGRKIVAAVFGTDSLEDLGITSYAAGLVSCKNIAQMFASAVDAATGASVIAAISTLIERDSNGVPTGLVRLDADRINFNGKNVVFQEGNSGVYGKIEIGFKNRTVTVNGQPVTERQTGLLVEVAGWPVFEVGGNFGSPNFTTWFRTICNIECRGLKADGDVKAESFTIKGQYYDENDDPVDVEETGYGELDGTTTFQTADGKTVTVMGGLIVDIS